MPNKVYVCLVLGRNVICYSEFTVYYTVIKGYMPEAKKIVLFQNEGLNKDIFFIFIKKEEILSYNIYIVLHTYQFGYVNRNNDGLISYPTLRGTVQFRSTPYRF